MNAPISNIGTLTVRVRLAEPIRHGAWTISHREYAIVAARSEAGLTGWAVSLSRDGPVGSIVKRSIAAHYIGQDPSDASSLFYRAYRSNMATLAWGVGLRALSLVDLAVWDLASRAKKRSILRLLGGESVRAPVTAVVGYPPTLRGEHVAVAVERLWDQGWRRFKLPLSATPQLTRERLLSAREVVGPHGWIGLDANGAFSSATEALAFLDRLGVSLGWIEDPLPAYLGAREVAKIRSRNGTPIAVGDEQASPYAAEALIGSGAVDVMRLDLTCMGGLTQAKALIEGVTHRGVAVSPHMYAHVHSQVFSFYAPSAPIEWGQIGTGVDPLADTLPQPSVSEGLMYPIPVQAGFGKVLDLDWALQQEFDDPDDVLAVEHMPIN